MKIYITIGGIGSRMRGLGTLEKQNFYFGKLRIIDWIKKLYPESETLGLTKTKSRLETLLSCTENDDILIIDCDVIPFELDLSNLKEDTIWCFNSEYNKYGNLNVINNRLVGAREYEFKPGTKASGVYFCKDLSKIIKNMSNGNPNSIAEAMIGAECRWENTFLRFGDCDDYLDSIKKERNYDSGL